MRSGQRWAAVAATALVLTTGAAAYAGDSPVPTPVAAPTPVATALPAPAPVPPPAPAPGYSAVGSWQLLALVNDHRRVLGLRPLTTDTRLAAVARTWAVKLAASGVLAHNNALFTSASHRTLQLTTIGENVGWNYSVTAQNAAFLKSPLHRANIDKPGFRVAGFAVVRGADGRIWSVEDFGIRAP